MRQSFYKVPAYTQALDILDLQMPQNATKTEKIDLLQYAESIMKKWFDRPFSCEKEEQECSQLYDTVRNALYKLGVK